MPPCPNTPSMNPIDDHDRERLVRAFDATPAVGATVSCLFPEDERPNRPGPKRRPCIVLDSGTQGDRRYLCVAYGTRIRADDATALELSINDPEGLAQAGLHQPTRFMFTRIRQLPFNDRFFVPNRDGTVVLGRIPERQRAAVEQIIREINKPAVTRTRRATPRRKPHRPCRSNSAVTGVNATL